jgi:hypothetical protein
VLLPPVFPGRLATRASIDALVLPRITANPSAQIRPASRAEALFALAPTSILLRPGSGAGTLEKLARLAERVPCYGLDLGHDLSGVPDLVAELLHRNSH